MEKSKTSWVYVLDNNKLQDNNMVPVTIDDLSILLIKKNNDIYAISNVCAHMGCLLEQGSLEAYFIKCVCHEWVYDIRDGKLSDAQGVELPTYATKISNGQILLNKEVGKHG